MNLFMYLLIIITLASLSITFVCVSFLLKHFKMTIEVLEEVENTNSDSEDLQ